MQHNLKTIQPYFDRVYNLEKTFEVRKDDRHFQSGDFVILHEYDDKSGSYTGRKVSGFIRYVLRDYEHISPGYVVFSLDIQHCE
ncbi:DUF3850 domain-containing protein [Niabella insulamsoli]|uniref:DUF3850 domain-containing protein n=1 Tax=Niabella insulamsoli TaxID=3144874 RepID=UPI003CCC63E5